MADKVFVVGEFYMGIPHSLQSTPVHMKCVRRLKRKIEFEYIGHDILSNSPTLHKVEMTFCISGCMGTNGVREIIESAHTSDKWSNACVFSNNLAKKPSYWDKYANK